MDVRFFISILCMMIKLGRSEYDFECDFNDSVLKGVVTAKLHPGTDYAAMLVHIGGAVTWPVIDGKIVVFYLIERNVNQESRKIIIDVFSVTQRKIRCLNFKEVKEERYDLRYLRINVTGGECITPNIYAGGRARPNYPISVIEMGLKVCQGADAMTLARWHKIFQHELMHVLGIGHMQGRSDRDKYVKVNYDNIPLRAYRQFDICTGCSSATTPYDCESIMHYTPYSAAINRSVPTITSLDPSCKLGDHLAYENATVSDWEGLREMLLLMHPEIEQCPLPYQPYQDCEDRCPKYIRPVCSKDGKTYPNRCKAGCDEAEIACYGKCPCKGCEDKCLKYNWQRMPVCSKNGKTYDNRCKAECDKAEVACPGKCPCKGCEEDCPQSYDPVCSKEGKQYKNQCYAVCDQAKSGCRGKCPCKPPKACQHCPPILNQVCGKDGETYGNKCVAECHNAEVKCKGKCPCLECKDKCPYEIINPVCTKDNKLYKNKCMANCDNAEIACEQECPCKCKGCSCCPREYKPVCATNGKTYDNSCKAKCDGARVQCEGECPCRPNCPNPCADTYAPVCAKNNITYINECDAKCDGTMVQCKGGCPCHAGPGTWKQNGWKDNNHFSWSIEN